MALPVSAPAGLVRKRSRSEPTTSSTEVPSPDGRTCRLCNKADSSMDPVLPGEFRHWYYARQKGKTQGNVCWYCGRVWLARFKHAHSTLTAMISACGQDSEMLASFLKLVGELVAKCQASGSHDIRIMQGELQPTVTRRNLLESGIEAEDEFVELQFYIHKYKGGLGDPRSNGLGHEIKSIAGETGVLVPGEPIKKIRRAQKIQIEQATVVDDGSLILEQSQQDTIMSEMFAQLAIPAAVGTVLAEAAKPPEVKTAPATDPPSSSTAPSTSSSAHADSSKGFFSSGPSFFNIASAGSASGFKKAGASGELPVAPAREPKKKACWHI